MVVAMAMVVVTVLSMHVMMIISRIYPKAFVLPQWIMLLAIPHIILHVFRRHFEHLMPVSLLHDNSFFSFLSQLGTISAQSD